MRALTVTPGVADSARLRDIGEPDGGDGLLLETVAVGVCGTDAEILAGDYGEAPAGDDFLVLGHEALARVVDAPDDTDLDTGDLVVPMVRWPDPQPCAPCAAGEWDMCRNGGFTEHGIKGRQGFARERFRLPPQRLVRVDAHLGLLGVLLEPTSIVAKAWQHIEHMTSRSTYRPRIVLVTGAGPVGLLAALLGVQRGFEVHVIDQVTDGPKPGLVRDLGAVYSGEKVDDLGIAPDIVIEATGVPEVVAAAMTVTAADGVTCLTGVSPSGRTLSWDVGALNRDIVLQNDVVFGSVNANRRHYEAAAQALAAADRAWLERVITRRVELDRFADALQRQSDDVKVVLDFAAAAT